MAQDFETLFKVLQDPAQKEALATRAAANGPPPDTGMANIPAVPGVTPPPAPNQQIYGGLAGIGSGAPTGTPEENKGKWVEFMDNLTNPEGPALPLLMMGSKLLQPRMSGQTQAGQIGAALGDFGKFAAANRAQQKKSELEERKVAATEQLTGARSENLEAGAEKTRRDTVSADVMDDLAKAKAELARAQARSEGTKGNSDVILFNTVAKALQRTYPEKYSTMDEAIVALDNFKTTKGKTPEADAMIALMENLPFMPEERVQPTLDIINKNLGQYSTPQGGPAYQARQDLPPVDAFPDEQWLKIENNPQLRKQVESAYGENIVMWKINQAKQRQNSGE